MELLCAPPETVEAQNSPWEHTSSTHVLAQPQTRMEYKHFENSETFEPFTGKRKISRPTFHLVSPFAPNASSTADQKNGRQRRNIHEDHGHGRQTERQHPRRNIVLPFINRMFQRTRHAQERRDAARRPRTRTATQARHYPPQDRSRRGGLVGREPGNDMLVGRRDLHPRGQQGTHLDLIGRGPNRLLRERVHRPFQVPHPPQGSARPETKGPAPLPIALGREPSALALELALKQPKPDTPSE